MTEFSEIYGLFLSNIHDYSILQLPDEDITEFLDLLLKKAIPLFDTCRVDLSDRTSVAFNQKLSDTEVDILVSYMMVSYLRPTILNTTNTQKELTDREFRSYSQANHLKELVNLYTTFVSEAESKKVKYGYKNWGKRNDK